jgi:tRNA pseudouridine55 synthase
MRSGILLLDKPLGLSSNAALQRVRTLFDRVKAGHVGSLDPLATGMLPVCLGEATKIAGDILAGRKRYRFTVALGSSTSTGDAEGEVTQRAAVPSLDDSTVEALLARFRGVQSQVPPMYSALKRDGQPLYRLARAGVTVARAPRSIELFELSLQGLGRGHLELETLCSKGTYIRVLAEDIAAALGSCGHVAALRRVAVEPFEHEPMQTLESLAQRRAAGASLPLLPLDFALQHLPAVYLNAYDSECCRRGQRVAARVNGARVRIYDAQDQLLGLGEADADGGLQPRRLFNLDRESPAPG